MDKREPGAVRAVQPRMIAKWTDRWTFPVVVLTLLATACGGKPRPADEPPSRAEAPTDEAESVPAPRQSSRSRFTGEIYFAPWSDESSGLRCRLGADRSRFRIGSRTPVLVLQVKNVSDQPLLVPDLFYGNMLVNGCPTPATYYSSDFQWIFDDQRVRQPLGPGEILEAACRMKQTLLRNKGECHLVVKLARGRKHLNAGGAIPRGKDWWSGRLATPPLTLTGSHGP